MRWEAKAQGRLPWGAIMVFEAFQFSAGHWFSSNPNCWALRLWWLMGNQVLTFSQLPKSSLCNWSPFLEDCWRLGRATGAELSWGQGRFCRDGEGIHDGRAQRWKAVQWRKEYALLLWPLSVQGFLGFWGQPVDRSACEHWAESWTESHEETHVWSTGLFLAL